MSKARDIADLDFNSPDIDGGNIDGATIGGTTPAAGTFSGLTVGGGVAQAIAGVQVSTSSAVSTDALANVNDGHFSIWNTNNSAVYSGLHFRTRTSGSTNALISLDYNSSFNDGELAFRIRNGSGSNDKMLSLKGNSGATFSGAVSAIGDIKAKSGNELRVYRTDNATYGSIEYLTGAGGLKLRDVNGDGMTFAGASSNYLTISGAGAATFGSTVTSTGLAVTQSGSVSSPPFSVSSNLNSGQSIAVFRSTSTSNATIDLRADGTGDPKILFDLNGASAFSLGVDNSDSDKFKISGGHLLGTNDRLVIDSAGNVRFNPGVIDSDFTVSSDGYSHMLHVDGGNNQVNIGTSADMGGLLNVRRNTANAFSTFFENVHASGYGQGWNSVSGHQVFMYHSGAHKGNISTASNYIKYSTGSSADLILQAGGTRDVVVNGDGVDTNFRVASDNQAHMLFVDGGNDAIGVGRHTALRDIATFTRANTDDSFGTTTAAIEVTNANNQVGHFSALNFRVAAGNYSESLATVSAKYSNYSGNVVGQLSLGTRGASSTNVSERMRIDETGKSHFYSNVDVNGNLHVTGNTSIASGNGILLGGTSSSHKLNDYEEGSWTPTVFNAGGSLTVSYNFQFGHFTKIGNLVQLYGSIRLNSASGGSGRAMVKGLPFTPDTALYACVGITHYNTALPGGGGADYKSNMIYDNGINFEVNSADQDTGEAIGSWEAGYIGFSITYRTSQ